MIEHTFQQFRTECHFDARLQKDRGLRIQDGDTTPEIRRERIRKAIVDCNLSDCRFGRRRDGVVETYREAFERFYQQPLQPKQRRRA